VKLLKPDIDQFAAALPAGYKVATGGTVEESAKAQGPINKVIPLMVFLMATFLMIQLHSVQKMFLVASVAPLGLIGVVLALVPTGTPMGFVAILGILALIGIIIRNSVILVTQIDALVFWGPMAYAMIGGIIVATLLTLLFLPALYVAWYKIREPKKEAV
jgi:multidrug efflux pump subunit AcrB